MTTILRYELPRPLACEPVTAAMTHTASAFEAPISSSTTIDHTVKGFEGKEGRGGGGDPHGRRPWTLDSRGPSERVIPTWGSSSSRAEVAKARPKLQGKDLGEPPSLPPPLIFFRFVHFLGVANERRSITIRSILHSSTPTATNQVINRPTRISYLYIKKMYKHY